MLLASGVKHMPKVTNAASCAKSDVEDARIPPLSPGAPQGSLGIPGAPRSALGSSVGSSLGSPGVPRIGKQLKKSFKEGCQNIGLFQEEPPRGPRGARDTILERFWDDLENRHQHEKNGARHGFKSFSHGFKKFGSKEDRFFNRFQKST